jgi:hypothetical protein
VRNRGDKAASPNLNPHPISPTSPLRPLPQEIAIAPGGLGLGDASVEADGAGHDQAGGVRAGGGGAPGPDALQPLVRGREAGAGADGAPDEQDAADLDQGVAPRGVREEALPEPGQRAADVVHDHREDGEAAPESEAEIALAARSVRGLARVVHAGTRRRGQRTSCGGRSVGESCPGVIGGGARTGCRTNVRQPDQATPGWSPRDGLLPDPSGS